MSLEMNHDPQPYSNTVIQVVLNNFTLVEIGMDGLFHRLSNFQNAVQARAFLLFRSLALDAIMEPRYLKSVTWFMEWRLRMTVNGHKLCFGCTDNKTKFCSGISSSGELELVPQHWRFQEGDVVSEVQVIQHFSWIPSRPARTGYHSRGRSGCLTQKVVNKNNKKKGGQNITLKNPWCCIKGFGDTSIHHYSAAGIAVKNLYGVDYKVRDAVMRSTGNIITVTIKTDNC